MNTIISWGTFIIFMVAVFKAGQSIYNQFIWSRDRKSQLKAAAQFKKDNEPISQLADKELTSLARVFWKESLNGAVTNEAFHEYDINPQVYRLFDFDIARKDWLFSNSAASVSNTLNGFEFFIPGVVRRWLNHNEPESIDIVFYKDVAIFVGAANEVDLFEESQTSLIGVPGVEIRQTGIETWYEAPAHCADFDAPLVNGGQLIRAIDGERMVLFKDESHVNGHLLIISGAAFFSLAAAVFGAAILHDTGQPQFLPRFSFSESFLILLPVFWVGGVVAFNTRQRLKFRHKPMIFFDRRTSKAYLKKPGTSDLRAVPWGQLNIRVSGQAGYLTGTPYSIRDNKLEFFATDAPHQTNVEFCATSLYGGLGVWKAIAMFMNGQIHSAQSITPWGMEYRKGDPQKDGLYLLERRIKTVFPELSITTKILHTCLFLITFGPLPYVIAARMADARVRQAFKLLG